MSRCHTPPPEHPGVDRWASRNKLTKLELPATRWGGPTGVIDTEARWQRTRHLLHDDTLNPEDRVAGMLVLLYAQQPATIGRLSLDHIHISEDNVRIRLGREPIVLPEPLADLVRTWSAPGAATPPLALRAPPDGCSPAANQADRSAPSNSPNDSANSGSTPGSPAPPHCSNSPPRSAGDRRHHTTND